MSKSKKPGRYPDARIEPDKSFDHSSLTQEENSSKPAGKIQGEVSGDKPQDTDASRDFIGPKGMDT